MNTVKNLKISLVSIILILSCKDEENSSTKNIINSEDDIAISDLITDNKNTEIDYLYVTSTSGLSLREYANLQSEKLAIMPYGTKVKIISSELNPTMKVGEISGGMDHIEFNHKKGFAFNGYLSQYFPPEKGISAKKYGEELLLLFPTVNYSETISGTASNPINTEILALPEMQWHEAFYMAQQLFNIPIEFVFPSLKGTDKEVVLGGELKKESRVSELQITRKNELLSKIKYKYKNKGFTKIVSIYKEGGKIIIENVEEIK